MATPSFVALLVVLLHCCLVTASWSYAQPDRYPNIPESGPKPNPSYMVDNQHNYFHAAPDKGNQNGPSWKYSGSFENYMANLRNGKIIRGGFEDLNSTAQKNGTVHHSKRSQKIQSRASSYWLPKLATKGVAPLATQSGYKVFRDVVADYGADSTGASDASESINAAVQAGNRCGQSCGNTFAEGAIIYFPPGNYTICSPIVQLYYTQFVGDAVNPPTIRGCPTFSGIALFDTDPYIPGGGGTEWFVNQNQFFRQIRNFIFDLTAMPTYTSDGAQPLVPTGIHWQVAQATSLQNLAFFMSSDPHTTQVGIFMENGSGGFLSNLQFYGGAVGFRAGSQQYTARSLLFFDCLTAVQMVWDWGFTWQDISISGGAIGFNISGTGGSTGQGIGSISLVDSYLNSVPIGILTNSLSTSPNIVLDNVHIYNVANIVQIDGASTPLLAGTSGNEIITMWAHGKRYYGDVGLSSVTGSFVVPEKSPGLLQYGSLYLRNRPQYETVAASGFLVATDHGCANDGTGDQAKAINAFLLKATTAGLIAFFPAGIYQVGSTVFIPTDSRVQGSLWSQIQGAGFYFSDLNNPQVMVRVGNKGDVGTMEIVEMLFSVKGPTAGAILMEWNVAADSQGSAAMWDSHFRVGGALGSDLDENTCPKFGFNDQCIAASLMFHVTPQASGYFENVWAWVADHDNDENMTQNPDPSANQVSVFGARGMLIESQGPSWFYGTSSEHSVLYNYQLYNAKDIYMGHIQTETPYYQPNPVAPQPFDAQIPFPADPVFAECDPLSQTCAAAWGLRIVDSSNVTIHGAGLYSFFQDFYQDCLATENCQDRILEVTGSTGVVIFNLFTVATTNIAVGIDNTAIFQNVTQSGFTTEVSVWIPLPGADNIDIIYVGTEVWSSPVVTGTGPCVLVLPTKSLSTSSTITPGTYVTSVEYGHTGTTTFGNGQLGTVFLTTITTLTLTLSDIIVGGIPFSNVNITSGETSGGFIATPSVSVPNVIVTLSNGNGGSTTRTLTLPPWPEITSGPPNLYPTGTNALGTTFHTQFTTTLTAASATVTTLTIPSTISALTVTCPPQSLIPFASPQVVIETDCPVLTTFTFPFVCPTTKVVTFLSASAGVFTVDCTFSFSATSTTAVASTTSSTATTTTPLPIWATWPYFGIYPVSTPVPSAQPTDTGVVVPCKLWFFDICIEFPSINIQGWWLRAPPGIYRTGPPPGIKWPPGWKIEGVLPPWPEITILPGGQISYDSDPKSCTTKSASICSTTTFYSATIKGTATVTTFTSTSATCATVFGCDVTNSNTATKTVSASGCPATPTGIPPAGCPQNAFVYPKNPYDVGEIPTILQKYASTYEVLDVPSSSYIVLYWVPLLDQQTLENLQASSDVDGAYYYEDFYANVGYPELDTEVDPSTDTLLNSRDAKFEDGLYHYDIRGRSRSAEARRHLNDSRMANVEDANIPSKSALLKRAGTPAPVQNTPYWELSQVSLAKGQLWGAPESNSISSSFFFAPTYNFHYDSSAGSGQVAYVINEEWVWETHPEFAPNPNPRILHLARTLAVGATPTGSIPGVDTSSYTHGSVVASKIIGAQLGACKMCTMAWFVNQPIAQGQPGYYYDRPENELGHIRAAINDAIANGRTGSAVLNLSFGVEPATATTLYLKSLLLLLHEADELGFVIVVSSGNSAKTSPTISKYPSRFLDQADPIATTTLADEGKSYEYIVGPILNMIVVGSTNKDTYMSDFSQFATWMTTFAPGERVYGPQTPTGGISTSYSISGKTYDHAGTSFAAPLVAAVAAYFRGLPNLPNGWSTQLEDPSNVKRLIVLFHRRFKPQNPVLGASWDATQTKPVVWNGQVWSDRDQISYSCLADYNTRASWDITLPRACPTIPVNLGDLELVGTGTQDVGSCSFGSGSTAAKKGKRQSTVADTCPAYIGNGGGGQSIGFTRPPTSALPGPTCPVVGGCGGTLCTGYYCNPVPTGMPPGFWDPKDPNAGNPVSTTLINTGTSVSATKVTTTPTTTKSTPPINTATFPPKVEPDIVFCYQDLLNCANNPCTVSSAYYFWYADDGASTCADLLVEGLGENVADPNNPQDLAVEKSVYHFPVYKQVPLGTAYSAQNCMFFPNTADGTGSTADAFYGPLPANYDVGTWWCSSGQSYDASSSVEMGNCYKRYTDSGVIASESNSDTWTLYYCRSELEKWQ